MKKEGLILVIGVNLALAVVVVAAALALFGPGSGASATPSPEKAVAARVAVLEDALAAERKRRGELDLALADLRSRVARLEEGIREGPPAGPAGPAGGEAGAPAAPSPKETPTEQMGRVFAKIMESQVKRQRDRYLRDLMNPTPESEARQARMIRRLADRVAQALSLDERDKEQVREILAQVDERRRETFRRIVRSHAKPDEIPFEEVKKALDDSWEEEDRLIEQALAPEKAEAFKKSAEPIRQLFEIAAKTAFPPRPEEDGR